MKEIKFYKNVSLLFSRSHISVGLLSLLSPWPPSSSPPSPPSPPYQPPSHCDYAGGVVGGRGRVDEYAPPA